MRERDLREDLKKGNIKRKYLIVSSEPLLIDNLLKTIRETLNINDAFDYETYSISEVMIEDIIPKLFLTPLASKYRLIIIKNLEDLDLRSLPGIGKAIKDLQFANILIMTYRTEKQSRDSIKRLSGSFTDVTIINIESQNPFLAATKKLLPIIETLHHILIRKRSLFMQ